MDLNETKRYARQMVLPNFGMESQLRLKTSAVLVIGAGGLGCPALQYLVGAGVGKVGIVDHDLVSLDNLHRQVLYQESDIGSAKVTVAKERLQRLNSCSDIVTYPQRLDASCASSLISGFDVVLDCTDDFSARYLIADTCLALGKPYVFGAVHRFEGQVSAFDEKGRFTLRDLFPEDPNQSLLQSCSADGVLGMLTGMVGCVQATQAIEILVHGRSSLLGKLWTFDLRTLRSETYSFAPFPETDLVPSHSSVRDNIPGSELPSLPDGTLLLDVREEYEIGTRAEGNPEVLRISLHRLLDEADRIPRNRPIAVFCETGNRSRIAARLLSDQLGITSVCCISNPEK